MRNATKVYLVAIHLLLVLCLYKSDFIPRLSAKLWPKPAEEGVGEHFQRMISFQSRVDGNLPEGAVVFIGNSLIEGLCVAAVACPSVNYGIGEDTTVGVMQRIPVYQSLDRAAAVVIAVGINDMKFRSNAEIVSNYESILSMIPEALPVVISGVLPLDEGVKRGWSGPSNERVRALNQELHRLAESESRVRFFDAGPLLVGPQGNLRDDFHNGDGVHLSTQGNAIWIREMKRSLEAVR